MKFQYKGKTYIISADDGSVWQCYNDDKPHRLMDQRSKIVEKIKKFILK